MLWRMAADLHEQRIGVMAPIQAFFGYPQPATSISATKVSPRRPATLIGVSLAEIAETPPTPDSRRRQGESASPPKRPRSWFSLRPYIGSSDDLAPGLQLAGREGREFLGRREVARAAQRVELGRGLGR